jgi:hypothetical protein
MKENGTLEEIMRLKHVNNECEICGSGLKDKNMEKLL